VETARTEACAEIVGQPADLGELVAIGGLVAARMAELTGPTARGGGSAGRHVDDNGGVDGDDSPGAGRAGTVEAGGCRPLGGDPGVLDQIVGLLRLENTVRAVTSELLREADRYQVAEQVTSTRLNTWLAVKGQLTARQASALVLGAKETERLTLVREAALAGAVNAPQVAAIADVLKHLPRELDQAQSAEAERVLVGLAPELASDGLGRASELVLEHVAPEVAQQDAEQKAARQLERAERKRYFQVRSNPDGTATLSGLLPIVEGEQVRAVIDAAAEKRRREQVDATGRMVLDRGQARADALTEICSHVQSCDGATDLGGTGARLVITIPASDLSEGGLVDGRSAGTGDRIDSAVLGTLACDSEVMRTVVGARGEVLDIGRASRIIPKAIRTALTVRDGGCAFPSCERPAEVCHAHHVQPWNCGGDTQLSNLCLLCPSHHRMVEPPKGRPPDWVPVLGGDGLWEFVPPKWFDVEQQPLLHQRFINRGARPNAPD
jgi:hypothetical protein